MAPKKELCRNFQRGSCRYGDQCKFLHATNINQQQQQQSKPNNFGFGKQQQSPNPFGFGNQGGNTQFGKQQQQQSPNPFGFGNQGGNTQFGKQQQQQSPNPFGFGNQGGNTQFGKQQQQQSPNPFGFGNQGGNTQFGKQQQPSSNPFGFGTHGGNTQSKTFNNNNNSTTATASKPNQFKPFENKWSRFSQNNNGGTQAARQPDNQPVSANHKCTDPETCKRQIIEDFEHERPLWKLTCYGHNKCAPCDIVGDTSYEELRAAAYNDAKLGLSLQSIVERERSLQNAKLLEFETLLRNPYVRRESSIIAQSSSPGFATSPFPTITPTNQPPSVSNFSQLGGFGMSQVPSQHQNGFGTTALPFGSSGGFGVQHPNPPPGNFFTSTTASSKGSAISMEQSTISKGSAISMEQSTISKGSAISMEQSTSFPSTASSQIPTLGSAQSPLFPKAPNSAYPTVDTKPGENEPLDHKIWLEDEWELGKIPEEAPPDKYIS